MKWWLVGLGVWLCGLTGCAGTETGNPPFAGKVGYDAYSSVPTRVALRAAEQPPAAKAPIQVDAAWLVLGNVSFLGDGECTGQGELGHAKALGAGDHVGTQAPPTAFELEPAKLCGVRLPIAAGEVPSSAPTELTGHSILLTGTRDGKSFRIASQARAEVLLRSDGRDIALDDDHPAVLIGFDVAAWLDSIEWSSINSDAGTLIVDDEHNTAQLAKFEAKIAAGIALFRDANGNGLLDSNEARIAHSQE